MKFLKSFLYKSSTVLIFLIIISCSKNFKNNNPILYFPKNIVKIEGSHAIFINQKKIKLNKNILSDDCESWAVDLKLEELLVNSYVELSKKMFQNLKIFEDEFTNSFLNNKKYNSVLILDENTAFIDFKTQGNKGIFKVSLESNFRVKGNKKEINNNINSQQTWEKNIYMNCNLPEGAKKATEEALKNLINQAHGNIYQSVLTVTK